MSAPESIRQEIRSWIAENWSLEITVREWWQRMADFGLSAPTWPTPWGRSYNGAQVRIVQEELAAAGAIAAPDTALGFSLAGPTIMTHGTEDQKQRFLP